MGMIDNHMKNKLLIYVFFATVIPSYASAADNAKWSWSQELPPQVTTEVVAINRTAKAVDTLFDHPNPFLVADILAALGQPDAFSPQAMYSKTKGTAKPSKSGGTLRFLLSDGGEVHIWTGDFKHVLLAIRYNSKGQGHLLYK